MELLKKVSSLLKEKGIKIATAESCTGGLVGHTLTNIPGSSLYFDRGVISYSNRAKVELLDVPEDIIERFGPVSEEVARAMAEGIRKKAKVDIGLSVTGIAGPTGGTKEKPVGLVYIGISHHGGTIVKKFQFEGDRLTIKERACEEALRMLLNLLEEK